MQQFRRDNDVSDIRLEEHHALALYAKLPSVEMIARQIAGRA